MILKIKKILSVLLLSVIQVVLYISIYKLGWSLLDLSIGLDYRLSWNILFTYSIYICFFVSLLQFIVLKYFSKNLLLTILIGLIVFVLLILPSINLSPYRSAFLLSSFVVAHLIVAKRIYKSPPHPPNDLAHAMRQHCSGLLNWVALLLDVGLFCTRIDVYYWEQTCHISNICVFRSYCLPTTKGTAKRATITAVRGCMIRKLVGFWGWIQWRGSSKTIVRIIMCWATR